MGTSQVQANADLDSVYGSGAPATIYAAFATAAPNYSANSGKGTIIEPLTAQYGAYARVPITNNTTNFPAAAVGSKTNGIAITFATSTGGASAPCPVTHLCFLTTNDSTYRIIDALALPPGSTVAVGDAPTFPISSVTILEA